MLGLNLNHVSKVKGAAGSRVHAKQNANNPWGQVTGENIFEGV